MHTAIGHNRARQRGSALILSVIIVAVRGLGCAAVWQYMQGTLQRTTQTERETEAVLLAEAGVEHMLAALDAQPGATESSVSGTLEEGVYTATLRPSTDGFLEIRATGTIVHGGIVRSEHRLVVALQPGTDPPVILRWEEEKKP